MVAVERVVVTLPYPIVVAAGALDTLGAVASRYAPAHRYAIVTDETVAPLYLERTTAALVAASAHDRVHAVVIPAGETQKTRERWASITDALLSRGCGRDSTIVALGGGVIGDLAGFVAATYMRGVPVIQVPTTLLAMVDASVGGKTAVDTAAGKNLVGAFHPPVAVIIDPRTLETLPMRHVRAGLAEVIKHGVIADRAEVERATAVGRELGAGAVPVEHLAPLIARSVRIKAEIVSLDEREGGRRKVLNFGHTVGHAVEAASGYALLHGEAVAIGMVAEALLAERAGVAEPGTAAAVGGAVTAVGLPARVPATLAPEALARFMRSDKKARQGALEYALPLRLGLMAGAESAWGVRVPDTLLLEVLRGLQ